MLSRSNPVNEKLLYWLLLPCLLILLSCRSGNQDQPLFSLMENTGIHFVNTVEDGTKDNSFLFRNFYNGGGVAIGDINNDGLADIFFTSNAGANKLYLNKGNFKFEDISEKAGILSDDKWNTGVVFADINADGWLDIYVCSSGHMSTGNRKNKLYINNGRLGFTDSAAAYGLDISAYTTQVSFFDYDRDGDLDCFMINNSPIPVNQLDFSNKRDLPDKDWPVADFLKGGGDHLFRNDKGRFVEVTRQAGIHGSLISFGLGVSVGDINDDGWPDVFVANDSYERDYLYINQGDGTFKDELTSWMQHISFSSMGADIADINNDGYPDLFTTDMFPLDHHRLKTMGAFDNVDLFNAKLRAGFYYQYPVNSMQLNDKNGMFKDIARYGGISATDWSWGALLFDMDNDGWNDILVCNGVNRDVTNLDFMNFFADEVYQKMVMTGQKKEIDQLLKQIPRTALPNKIFRNNKDLRFSDSGEQWGMGQKCFSNGAAYGDLDNDGDLDLVISNENQPSFVYRNNSRQQNGHHYIGFSLKGNPPNPFAIGTKIKLYSGNQIWLREQVPSRGFQSSMDYKILVGLGTIKQLDSIVVTWPGQRVTVLKSPPVDQVHLLQEPGDGPPVMQAVLNGGDPFFEPQPAIFEKHAEDDVIDFYTERNIPRLLSREGPKAAVADVNADGLEDVYIGGTPGHPGQLYLQGQEGIFKKKEEKAFLSYSDFEDVAVLFFDADRDNDQDLLVCPGGNTAGPNSRQLQLRLFRNDSRGNFSIDINAFPPINSNISVALDHDFTGDGYPDLFIGGRNQTGLYGKDPRSYLFVNDGKGRFLDQTNSLHPGLSQIGMVCGAAWADLAGDTRKELVIAGEWMSPRVFSVAPGRFEEVRTNLSGLFGWWQTMAAGDINGDGKEDLLLGNIGENFYLRPDSLNPVKLWIHDYDQNGSLEKIMTSTVEGRDMPVFLKKDMEDQLPSIKKSNLKNEEYARRSIRDLFSPETLNQAQVKQFNYPVSIAAINKGNGRFEIRPLPVMMQLSCINVFRLFDIEGDGDMDILAGGNQFGFLPQFERLDASLGDVLVNDGKGNFSWQERAKTGLTLRGEMRDIQLIRGRTNTYFLFLQNDQLPLLFKRKKTGGPVQP